MCNPFKGIMGIVCGCTECCSFWLVFGLFDGHATNSDEVPLHKGWNRTAQWILEDGTMYARIRRSLRQQRCGIVKE